MDIVKMERNCLGDTRTATHMPTKEEFREAIVTEPTTQTETQNSNLTFEKRTMRDCYNCKRYETEDECIECHYEPKDDDFCSRGERKESE